MRGCKVHVYNLHGRVRVHESCCVACAVTALVVLFLCILLVFMCVCVPLCLLCLYELAYACVMSIFF